MSYYIGLVESKFYVPTEFTGRVMAKAQEDFQFSLDEVGNIVEIELKDDSLYDKEETLESIAPYVKEGSFLHIRGEEGAEWKWVFRNGTCEEIRPKVSWE